MTLIVEDGSQVFNAESYITVANAITYLTSRGNTSFAAAVTADQENALRNATDFMVAQFRYRWAGYRRGIVQNLDWPRQYVPVLDVAFGYGPAPSYLAFDIVPIPVMQACADLAVRALVGDLAPDIDRIEKSVAVGPIKVEYDPNQPAGTTFVAVITKLDPFLVGQGQRTTLVRT